MRLRSLRLLLLLGFGVGFVTLSRVPAEDPPEVEAARAALFRLAQNLDSPNVSKMAKQLVHSHESSDISSIFKLKERGGVGIGTAVEAGHRNSIERLIIDWSGNTRKATTAELEKHQTDLLQTAKLLRAMAELAPFRASDQVRKNERLSSEWTRVSREFKGGAEDLQRAIESKDATKAKAAAQRFNHTCCDCHNMIF